MNFNFENPQSVFVRAMYKAYKTKSCQYLSTTVNVFITVILFSSLVFERVCSVSLYVHI